jgi:shikimate dehydrogenase
VDADAHTRLIALLGDPVEHSLSPRFQSAAIRAAGVNAVYVALRCGADFEALLRGIARAGGAGNITLPHKTRAVPLLDRATAAVAKTGACNTFWLEQGRIHGDNTDVQGFAAAARSLIGAPAGARVLVLGAGGAARAAVAGLMEARADAVHVLNRSPDHARSLQEALDSPGRRVRVLEGVRALGREGYDLVVNATSLGLAPDDPVPLDLDLPVRVGAVLDLTYGAAPSALVTAARAAGIPAADGREMLLQQGAASFRRWFGIEPDLPAMRHALIGD